MLYKNDPDQTKHHSDVSKQPVGLDAPEIRAKFSVNEVGTKQYQYEGANSSTPFSISEATTSGEPMLWIGRLDVKKCLIDRETAGELALHLMQFANGGELIPPAEKPVNKGGE